MQLLFVCQLLSRRECQGHIILNRCGGNQVFHWHNCKISAKMDAREPVQYSNIRSARDQIIKDCQTWDTVTLRGTPCGTQIPSVEDIRESFIFVSLALKRASKGFIPLDIRKFHSDEAVGRSPDLSLEKHNDVSIPDSACSVAHHLLPHNRSRKSALIMIWSKLYTSRHDHVAH